MVSNSKFNNPKYVILNFNVSLTRVDADGSPGRVVALRCHWQGLDIPGGQLLYNKERPQTKEAIEV